MRRISPLLLLLLLIPASPASAKGVASAKVCGPAECREVDDHVALAGFEGGMPGTPPGAKAPWYRTEITLREGDMRHLDRVVFVPFTGSIRSYRRYEGEYLWTDMPADAGAALRRTAAGLEPYPASTLAGTGPVDPNVNVDEVILPPDDPVSDGGLAWPLAAAILAALGALLAGGWLWVRRRSPLSRPQATPDG